MKRIVIILAILLLCLDGIGVYREFQNYQALNQRLEQEADYVRDVRLISEKSQEYNKSLSAISDQFYTDERLFILWRTLEDKFGASFINFSLNPTYVEADGLRWFTGNITVKTDPVTFMNIINTVRPKIFVMNINYNRLDNTLTAPIRGVIVSDNNGFVLTPSVIQESSYVVCRYIMSTKHKELLPNSPEYLVSVKGDVYYVGIPLERGLDALAAENVANKYSQQGMVTFIAKDTKEGK